MMITRKKTNLRWWILLISFVFVAACSKNGKIIDSQVQYNSKESLSKPYIVLISLDGFRWDYVERFKPPHLSNFIEKGVQSESLIPSFPSKTFPNHYTIATGMYPDKNKIIGNAFYDYDTKLIYSMNDRKSVEDGHYYGGSPIWVQAAISGMVTASYYFVGSEAKINGVRPSYYYNFNGRIKNKERVNQALNWLALPAKERPHLITLYFSDLDNTGHKYGPNNNEQLKKKIFALDHALDQLFKGIQSSKLPVNTIFVSDHGMMEVAVDRYMSFDSFENKSDYMAINNGSIINIHPKHSDNIEQVYKELKNKEKDNNFKVYKTENTPGFEYVPKNKNWGPIQIVADNGFYFIYQEQIEKRKASGRLVFGQHGFDPVNKEMHGIFYANGPAFKKGHKIPSFKNIHIYPLMCKILGLNIPDDIDGQWDQLESILR